MSKEDDIVTTLRECAKDSRASEGDYYADQFATSAEVFDLAADEIERLRARDKLWAWCAEKTRELFGNAIVPQDVIPGESTWKGSR